MKKPFRTLNSILLCIILIFSLPLQALTTKQFLQLCGDKIPACNEHPPIQFYLGGALDALAVANENGRERGNPIYCREEKHLFNMREIVRHISDKREQFQSKNVVWAVMDYLSTYGECREAE